MLKSRNARDFATCSGSPEHVVYAPKVSRDGVVELIPTGTENLHELIQSHRESCDIQSIMRRVAAGQLDLLKSRPGSYGDFTKMPKTYAEVLQLQINASHLFDSLPPDVKRQFDNSADVFLAQAGSPEWVEAMRPVIPEEVFSTIAPKAAAAVKAAEVKDVVKEVKPDES